MKLLVFLLSTRRCTLCKPVLNILISVLCYKSTQSHKVFLNIFITSAPPFIHKYLATVD